MGKERTKVHKNGQAGSSNEKGTSGSKAIIYILGALRSLSVREGGFGAGGKITLCFSPVQANNHRRGAEIFQYNPVGRLLHPHRDGDVFKQTHCGRPQFQNDGRPQHRFLR